MAYRVVPLFMYENDLSVIRYVYWNLPYLNLFFEYFNIRKLL